MSWQAHVFILVIVSTCICKIFATCKITARTHVQLTELIVASSQSSRCQSQVTMGERTESNITSIASDN